MIGPQDDTSDDEDHENVFKVKEEIIEDENNYHEQKTIKVEKIEYENEISTEDETGTGNVWKRVTCPECQREIHPHSLSRHLSDVHKFQSSLKPSTLGPNHLLL